MFFFSCSIIFASPNFPFKKGEELNYSAYWSFFKIAKIKTYIDTNITYLKDKICNKAEINAQMSNVVKVFASIDEIFGAYIDTHTLLPVTSYRYLKEGKYTHDEVSYYDFDKKKIILTVLNKNTDRFETKDSFLIHKNIFDLVTGYFQFRNFNFNEKQIGETVMMNLFIEHELYPVFFKIFSREVVKVNGGKFKTICFVPTIPNNQVFNSKYPMKFWVSDDENKIFVKAEVKLGFGKITLELNDFKNLAYPLNSKL